MSPDAPTNAYTTLTTGTIYVNGTREDYWRSMSLVVAAECPWLDDVSLWSENGPISVWAFYGPHRFALEVWTVDEAVKQLRRLRRRIDGVSCWRPLVPVVLVVCVAVGAWNLIAAAVRLVRWLT